MQDTDESHPKLEHDDTYCDLWRDGYFSAERIDDRVFLSRWENGVSEEAGDWAQDEMPNCPSCGANIIVEAFHETFSLWEWFTGNKADYEEA